MFYATEDLVCKDLSLYKPSYVLMEYAGNITIFHEPIKLR